MTAPDQQDFALFVSSVLDALKETGIDYMIGGAVAVWAWGEVRTTRDLDLVVDLPVEAMPALSRALATRGMLLPFDVMLDVFVQSRSDLPLAVMDMNTGYKAEFFLLREGDDQRRLALSRKLLADFGPPLGEVWVHSPEDLILYKLRFFALSRQTKHVRDIASIVATLGGELDTRYLEERAHLLGLADVWQEIRDQVERRNG